MALVMNSGMSFSGMVVRAVRVRAAGDDGIDAVRRDVAPDEQLAGRLGRGVRRSRREPVVLGRPPLVDRAVDLVGRDLQEARRAGRDPARLEQDVDADHPGREERLRIEDRAIDVRFGREVEDRIRGRDEWRDDRRVGDVAADEGIPGRHLGVVADGGQVRLVAGIGQLVEDRDPGPVTAGKHVPHVARPDETGATGDEQVVEPSFRAHALIRPGG